MNRVTLRVLVGVASAISLGLTACGAVNEAPRNGSGSDSGLSGSISGAGASSQAAAVTAWKAAFETENGGVTVNYDPFGSGGGREQFLDKATSFAGSDAYLADEELSEADERCEGGELIEFPVYVSPIAVAYNLNGVEDLQLSARTVALIFDQQITNWNDAAIQTDNPDVDLPDVSITPVNRSDESGTTENFTEYLGDAAKDAWPHEASGDWPVSGGTAAQGASGVVEAIGANNGSVGYADESQLGALPAAKIKVGEEFVEISAEAAANIVDSSDRVAGRGQFDYAIDLKRDTADSGTYPIALVSYALACTAYPDAEEAALVKAWLGYIASEEGQQVSAASAGSAPLSEQARKNAESAIEAIR